MSLIGGHVNPARDFNVRKAPLDGRFALSSWDDVGGADVNQQQTERRLCALVAVDIAGYSGRVIR